MSAGTAAAGTNLVLDSARFQSLLTAQRSTAVPGTEMVEAGAVDEARMAVEADTVAFALAGLVLGGALVVRHPSGIAGRRPGPAAAPDRSAEHGHATRAGVRAALPRAARDDGRPLRRGTRLPPAGPQPPLPVAGGHRRQLVICPEDSGGFFPARGVAKHGDLAAPTGPVPPQPEIPAPPGGRRRGPAASSWPSGARTGSPPGNGS